VICRPDDTDPWSNLPFNEYVQAIVDQYEVETKVGGPVGLSCSGVVDL